MIFRQLFDRVSCTFTYLLASRPGGEACLIDPVLGQVDRYLALLAELKVELVKAIDTHLHADHITGLGVLHAQTHCATVMGEESAAEVVSLRIRDGDRVEVGGSACAPCTRRVTRTIPTCFLVENRLFTGDTLHIRGTGRTDFQNGDAARQYDSLFNKLLRLPDETLVYLGHDYKGDTVSTVGEEKAHNPRLQVGSVDEYVELMNGLGLPRPKLMDLAVPANLRLGLHPV
jgi:sulfur dioxygenase